MKLYCSPGSPYARMARIVLIEKQLGSRVEVIFAKTRSKDSPYYAINPSGRVPYLVREDGVGLEESQVICAYLDELDGRPTITVASGWEARRLEALARSLVDGLAVWLRELSRPANERSPTVIEHEIDRAARLLDVWEREIAHPVMNGPLNMAQLTLACGIGMAARNRDFQWRANHAKLAAWFDAFATRPSFIATAPPSA